MAVEASEIGLCRELGRFVGLDGVIMMTQTFMCSWEGKDWKVGGLPLYEPQMLADCMDGADWGCECFV